MRYGPKRASIHARLAAHVDALLKCRACPSMKRPSVSCGPVASRILLVGQAPGDKEPVMGRPFAWTAGRTLFGWFREAAGISEEQFRAGIYMAAVCRCFPGKRPEGGDRVPDRDEVQRCSAWLSAELDILRPQLIIPVGKLGIEQFLARASLNDVVGRTYRGSWNGRVFDLIPLPHPSGASPWHRMEPGKTLLRRALGAICEHPAFRRAFRNRAG